MVFAIAVLAAHRIEIGLLQRRPHGILIAQITIDLFHRTLDQHDRVIGLSAVKRRILAVLREIIVDETLVGRIQNVR